MKKFFANIIFPSVLIIYAIGWFYLLFLGLLKLRNILFGD